MGIRNKFINSNNQLTSIGTIIFTIICLAFAAGSIYFIYCLFKGTKKETKGSLHSKKENFYNTVGYLDDLAGYIDDGYYNIIINNKLIGLTEGQNPRLTYEENINRSDNINKIFFITKYNQKNRSNEDNKKYYYIIPLKRAGKINIEGENISLSSISYPAFNEDNSKQKSFIMSYDNSTSTYKVGKIIENDIKYFSIQDVNTGIKLEPESKSKKQEVKLVPHTELHYHFYENGIYTISTEDDPNKKICRIERVLGKPNTYNILLHKSDQNSERLSNNLISLDKDKFIGYRAIDNLEKSNTSNQFYIQPGQDTESKNITSFIVQRNDSGIPYSRRANITKYSSLSGVTNGYYLISYKIGNTYYLLTYENNELFGNVVDNNINNLDTIKNIINKSEGNDLFLIKNTTNNYHSIQIGNKKLELDLNSNDNGNYSLFFNKIDNNIEHNLKIHKEHNSTYTFNYEIPNNEDEYSDVTSKTLYLNIYNNKLMAPSANDSITSDNSSTRLYLTFIAPPETRVSNNDIECVFYSRFLKRTDDKNITILSSIDNQINLYKESELRDLNIFNSCNTNNNINYVPSFVYKNDKTNDYLYKENLYESDYEKELLGSSIEDPTDIKTFDNSTVYNCANECNNDTLCKRFLFHKQNKSEAYLGDCKLIYNKDLTKVKTNNNPALNQYTSYNKNVKVLAAIPTEKQLLEPIPPVINNKDNSCSIRGSNLCEDKHYCILKGNNCLRKCKINDLNGTTIQLDVMDADSRCIGSLHDYDIIFQEVNRDFDINSPYNSITIKIKEINLINITKRLHHPILKYNNGFEVQFKCIGNNAIDTDFEVPIEYKLENDNYKVDENQSKLILGDKIDEVNIQVPQEIVECSAKGYTLILKLKLTDIYDQSKIIDVLPLDKDNKIVYDVTNKINKQEYFNKISLGRSIHNIIDSKINAFHKI